MQIYETSRSTLSKIESKRNLWDSEAYRKSYRKIFCSASMPWAYIVFNLHVEHSEKGLERAQKQFQGLIDIALNCRRKHFLDISIVGF